MGERLLEARCYLAYHTCGQLPTPPALKTRPLPTLLPDPELEPEAVGLICRSERVSCGERNDSLLGDILPAVPEGVGISACMAYKGDHFQLRPKSGCGSKANSPLPKPPPTSL